MTEKCLFCAIAKKEIPAKVVYEDDNCLAILDINPRSTGMTLVIPKRHLKDFSENTSLSTKVFSSALIVAEKIRGALHPKDIGISILPSELQHFHIRIYPIYENEVPLMENQPKKVSENELNDIARKIISAGASLSEKTENIPAKKHRKPKEKKKSKGDMFWIKRSMQLT